MSQPQADWVLGTTRLSIAAIRGYGETNFDAYHAWHDKFEFGPAVTIKVWGGSCASFKQKFEGEKSLSSDLVKKRDASIERNLVALLRAYPEVTFHLFLPPLATLIYVPANSGLLSVHLPFRIELDREVLELSNVRLFDFQSDSTISDDLTRFKDPLHFDLATTRQVIKDLREGNHRVRDFADMLARNSSIVAMVNQYDLCQSGQMK